MSAVAAGIDSRITRAVIGALRDRDLSGFELWQWLGPVRGSGQILDEAGLYPTLHRLEAQGLIASSWREDGGTRRTYRITAAGLAEAQRNGWGLVAPARRRGSGRAAAADSGEAEWIWRSEFDQPTHSPDQIEYRAVEAYVAELDCALRLDPLHRHDADAEIGDHLSASIARRELQGERPQEASDSAIAAMGPAVVLAGAIDTAQQTRPRLAAGLSWGSAVGMLTSLAALAVTVCVAFLATPVLADALTRLASLLGVHLFAPGGAEWRTEQVAVSGWVGAFVGARRSTPHFAFRSRRSEEHSWHIWAAAGAVFLTAVVVLFPFRMDGFAVLTLFGIPFAWILGTRHPGSLYGETVTARGVAAAAVIGAVALLMPGARVWAYDAASSPRHGDSFAAGAPVTASWRGDPEGFTGRMVIAVASDSGWSQARLEIWPAAELGPVVLPDSSARAPVAIAASGELVDLEVMPHSFKTWWFAVTAVGPDGTRHTVQSSVHAGWRRHGRTDMLGWLLGWR